MLFLKSLIQKILILAVRFYQVAISPLIGKNCRHYPSCSEYAVESLKKHGSLRALMLILWRIVRCNPFGTYGYDPVPEVNTKNNKVNK